MGVNLLTCACAGGHSGLQYRNVNFCSVVGCGNRDKDISYFSLPAIVMAKARNFKNQRNSEEGRESLLSPATT